RTRGDEGILDAGGRSDGPGKRDPGERACRAGGRRRGRDRQGGYRDEGRVGGDGEICRALEGRGWGLEGGHGYFEYESGRDPPAGTHLAESDIETGAGCAQN